MKVNNEDVHDAGRVKGKLSMCFFRQIARDPRFRPCIGAMLYAYYSSGADDVESDSEELLSAVDELVPSVVSHWDSLSEKEKDEWIALAGLEQYPQPQEEEEFYVPPCNRMSLTTHLSLSLF